MNLESRQLGGVYDLVPLRRLRRALSDKGVVVTARIAGDKYRVGRSFVRIGSLKVQIDQTLRRVCSQGPGMTFGSRKRAQQSTDAKAYSGRSLRLCRYQSRNRIVKCRFEVLELSRMRSKRSRCLVFEKEEQRQSRRREVEEGYRLDFFFTQSGFGCYI